MTEDDQCYGDMHHDEYEYNSPEDMPQDNPQSSPDFPQAVYTKMS